MGDYIIYIFDHMLYTILLLLLLYLHTVSKNNLMCLYCALYIHMYSERSYFFYNRDSQILGCIQITPRNVVKCRFWGVTLYSCLSRSGVGPGNMYS